MKWSKRHKKTFGKKTRETDATQGSFRYPPKPDSYYTKIEGQCRWCGNMILNEDGTINSRRNWHEDCSEEYMFYYHSGATRQKVYERDLGKCNYCGDITTRWELDHINPLSEQKNVPRDKMDWSYWSIMYYILVVKWFVQDIFKAIYWLWQLQLYKRHLARRIKKNDFGRREEW